MKIPQGYRLLRNGETIYVQDLSTSDGGQTWNKTLNAGSIYSSALFNPIATSARLRKKRIGRKMERVVLPSADKPRPVSRFRRNRFNLPPMIK